MIKIPRIVTEPFVCELDRVVVCALLSFICIIFAVKAVHSEQEREAMDAALPADFDPRFRVDLDTASADVIALLPGMGPVRAAELVRARARGFKPSSRLDLRAVPGIGPATVEGLRGHTTLPEGFEPSTIETPTEHRPREPAPFHPG